MLLPLFLAALIPLGTKALDSLHTNNDLHCSKYKGTANFDNCMKEKLRHFDKFNNNTRMKSDNKENMFNTEIETKNNTTKHSVKTINRVKAGIQAGAAIVKLFSTKGGVGKVIPYIGPFLDSIGAALEFFVATQPSWLKQEFARINANFDKISDELEDIKKLLYKMELGCHYVDDEKVITSLSYKLQKFLNASRKNAKKAYNDSFVLQYRSGYNGAALNLWRGMTSKNNAVMKNIPLAAMQFLHDDKDKVMDFLNRVFKLILQGAKNRAGASNIYWR